MLNSCLVFGDLVINLANRRVAYGHKDVSLSKLEFDLLVYLARRTNQVCAYDTLLDEVWHYEAEQGHPRLVQLAVYRLKEKFGHYGSQESLVPIRTIRGVGLCFDWLSDEREMELI